MLLETKSKTVAIPGSSNEPNLPFEVGHSGYHSQLEALIVEDESDERTWWKYLVP